ncbi:MAG: DNRLRE domain-containing protein [Planifilum sp.]
MPISVFNPIQNVYIASAYPDTNFANRTKGDVLFVGTFTGAADIYRSLLQFNLSEPTHGIPPNSTIRAATLVLNMYRNDRLFAAQVSVYRLLDFFNQKTVTFNSAPGSSFPARIAGPDTPVVSPSSVRLGVTELVRGWYSGTIPNTGVELRGIEDANDNIIGFRSTRFPDSTVWPSLEVVWAKGTVSITTTDSLIGAPNQSRVVDMRGQEQATFLINNTTNGNLQGFVQVSQDNGATMINDPSTLFNLLPGQQTVINYTTAADLVRVRFTAAGAGAYTVQSKTRDE